MKTKIKISQIAAIAASALVCAALLIAVWHFAELRLLVMLPIAASPAVFFIYNSRLRNAERKIEADRATKTLQESERRFRATFDHAGGMGLTGSKGEWIRVNRSLCQMLGYPKEQLIKTTLQSISHPEDREWMGEQISNLFQGSIESVQLEQRLLRQDHKVVWVVLSLTKIADAPGESARLILQVQDITDRKRVEERLMHEALHDALTGLPNRALYMDHLRKAVARWKRRDRGAFAVLFLDLDGFKGINDTLGHLAGDHLLVEFTQRVTETSGPEIPLPASVEMNSAFCSTT